MRGLEYKDYKGIVHEANVDSVVLTYVAIFDLFISALQCLFIYILAAILLFIYRLYLHLGTYIHTGCARQVISYLVVYVVEN